MTKKAQLLIIEDEVAIRDGLIDVFVYHGFDVDSCGNGSKGLEKALTGTYDMILLDIMLPGMNGFDVCDAIRARDRNQPIIMLTAKSSDEEIIHGLKLGADDYVAKPFSVQQLVLRVEAVLRRSEEGRLEGGTSSRSRTAPSSIRGTSTAVRMMPNSRSRGAKWISCSTLPLIRRAPYPARNC